MVRTVVPRINTASHNALGQYVMREKGGISIREIARRGQISDVKLSRWLRSDISRRMPPPDVLQAIAVGLGRPLAAVQQVALRATGQGVPAALGDEQQTVVAAMAQVDEFWQRAISDTVLRIVEEVLRSEERLQP